MGGVILARLWTTGLRPDRLDAYERFARDVSLPMFREQDGFLGCVMVRSGHKSRVLTFWRDRSAIHALETSPSYRDTVQRIQEADLLADAQHTAIYQLHLIDVDGAVSP
jgi:heme-degrading monooxygenase HmoA